MIAMVDKNAGGVMNHRDRDTSSIFAMIAMETYKKKADKNDSQCRQSGIASS
jgi:hypothetical protein